MRPDFWTAREDVFKIRFQLSGGDYHSLTGLVSVSQKSAVFGL